MEIIKSFTENNLHTDIVVKGTSTDPLFRASDIGEILELANVRSSIQHFDESEKVLLEIESSTGKHQVTFLTEKGLYKLLFKSRKQIAEQCQDWVCEVVKEIRQKGVYDLNRQLELEAELEKHKSETQDNEKICKELECERVLLNKYRDVGSIVYIIRVKTNEDGTYVIKIGESRKGITERYNECRAKHKNILLLNCFSVNRSKDFEKFLHHHKNIFPNKCKTLSGHENENELFLVGTSLSYQMLLKIVEDNIDEFNYTVRELLLENKLLKSKLNSSERHVEIPPSNSYSSDIKMLLEKMSSIEEQVHRHTNLLNAQQSKVSSGFNEPLKTVGPRVQKINPENLQLVQVYECVSDIMKENALIKRPSIMKAIDEHTVYCGFRWMLVDRNLDPSVLSFVHPTKETKETKLQNLGYVAKVDGNKTQILNVYLDRKTAAKFNEYPSNSSLDNHVKNGTLTNGHYYILYQDCDPVLIANFEEEYGKPLLFKNGVGQYDLDDNLIKIFACKYDCLRTLHLSDKTLAKCLEKKVAYNNCFFKEIGSKLQVASNSNTTSIKKN